MNGMNGVNDMNGMNDINGISCTAGTSSPKLPNPEMVIYYHVGATITAICIWRKSQCKAMLGNSIRTLRLPYDYSLALG